MFSQSCALMLSFSTLYNSPPHLSKTVNSITCISHGEKSSNSSFTPSPLGVIALGSDTGHSSSQSVPSSTSMYPAHSQPFDSITKGYRDGLSTIRSPTPPSAHRTCHSSLSSGKVTVNGSTSHHKAMDEYRADGSAIS